MITLVFGIFVEEKEKEGKIQRCIDYNSGVEGNIYGDRVELKKV